LWKNKHPLFNLSENKRALKIVRILAFLFVLIITGLTIIYSKEISRFKEYGYPGIFLVSLLANSTVLIPAPGVVFVFAMANLLNPFGVALSASLGGTLGELSGYLAGFSGQAIIERIDLYKKIEPLVTRYGGFAVLLLAAIPNPFFDFAGIAAGGLKMPIKKFLLFCWIGQFIKMTIFAIAGYYSIGWIKTK
jgi:membrane protein YqaA with SNARE-associated domain